MKISVQVYQVLNAIPFNKLDDLITTRLKMFCRDTSYCLVFVEHSSGITLWFTRSEECVLKKGQFVLIYRYTYSLAHEKFLILALSTLIIFKEEAGCFSHLIHKNNLPPSFCFSSIKQK